MCKLEEKEERRRGEKKNDAREREGKEFTAERGDLETQTTFHPVDFGVKDLLYFWGISECGT